MLDQSPLGKKTAFPHRYDASLLFAIARAAQRSAIGLRGDLPFDGADLWTAPPGRRRLRIEFSPAGVSADDVIVDLVGSLPADRPVVVATNDGEVRAGARAGGANVISSEQLLAVARR